MSETSLWWMVVGALVGLELLTLTFYLLMLAAGAVAGAVAAHMGLALPMQILAAAVVSALAVGVCYAWRSKRRDELPASADRNVNLDVGETVQVSQWRADGTASVRYRGAPWTAMCQPGTQPQPGSHRVVEVVGSRLMLERL